MPKFLRSRWLAVVAVVPALLFVAACGDDDESPTTPDGTQADIRVTALVAIITPSPVEGFRLRATVPSTVTESGGVGANIDYVRMQFLEEVGDPSILEVAEISADQLIEMTGSNRIEANSSRDLTLPFDYNSLATLGTLVYAFTDDRGNQFEEEFLVDFGL